MADLVQQRTALDAADLDWLHGLVGEWQLLADLSFADLLLWVPTAAQADPVAAEFLAVAQLRPTTGPTSYPEDRVGEVSRPSDDLPLAVAWREGRIVREGDPDWRAGVPVRVEAIPVRRDERVIAVVGRETNLAFARTPSRLELTYLQSAGDLAQMIAEGSFPFLGAAAAPDLGTRVGDGLLRLDVEGRVTYASPNALSAYRRLGHAGDLVGHRLAALTVRLAPEAGAGVEPPAAVAAGVKPRSAEVEARGAVVQLRAIPLLPGGSRIGALVLVRDVTELRHRDRQLLTKDATIREIHHRVKNNLQTVAALLRLQSRRLEVPEARQALAESVRRVAAIALVHETLSQALEDMVDFDDIADRVLAMVADMTSGVGDPPRVALRRAGTFGMLPAATATPLSMVLTELVQNAVEHAFGHRAGGWVEVLAERRPGTLEVLVRDDGVGLPPGFSLERTPRLGLQIVRTLVVGELAGSITLGERPGGGTEVRLLAPLAAEDPAVVVPSLPPVRPSWPGPEPSGA
jgi:two-component system, sensor histidine kinase PdtaS